ncbi:MAG: hypothetical protein WEB00_01980 [Dehalococcoidia bacterium]
MKSNAISAAVGAIVAGLLAVGSVALASDNPPVGDTPARPHGFGGDEATVKVINRSLDPNETFSQTVTCDDPQNFLAFDGGVAQLDDRSVILTSVAKKIFKVAPDNDEIHWQYKIRADDDGDELVLKLLCIDP